MLSDTMGPSLNAYYCMHQCMIFLSSVVQVVDAGFLEGGGSFIHYRFVCKEFEVVPILSTIF